MDTIRHWDYLLVKAATEVRDQIPYGDQVVYFCAELLIFWFLLAAALFAMSGRTKRQKEKGQDTAIAAIAAVLLAIGLRWLLGEVWFRERPFVTHQLDALADLVSPTDNSFPSMHAMMAFAFAGTVQMLGAFPKWAKVLLVLAALVALGRVFAGVHYLTDIVFGAALGLGIAKLVSWQSLGVRRDMR